MGIREENGGGGKERRIREVGQERAIGERGLQMRNHEKACLVLACLVISGLAH